MRIAVKRLIRQERTQDGEWSLVVMADLGETVRAACTIVLSAREAETIADALQDRRNGQRRKLPSPAARERRVADRRIRDVQVDLERYGRAVVEL